MPPDLPRLNADPNQRVRTQDTEFSRDVLGRYICNTFDEAERSTLKEAQPEIRRGERLDAKKFDIIVIGHVWSRFRRARLVSRQGKAAPHSCARSRAICAARA
jgi:transcription termination factor Rho